MATIAASILNPAAGDALVLTFTPMVNGDVGAASDCNSFGDRSIQVFGTFGAGGSVALEGSNDGVNWFALRDPSSTTIALTAAGIKQVLEMTRFVRPHVTAGDGTTSLTAILFARRTQR